MIIVYELIINILTSNSLFTPFPSLPRCNSLELENHRLQDLVAQKIKEEEVAAEKKELADTAFVGLVDKRLHPGKSSHITETQDKKIHHGKSPLITEHQDIAQGVEPIDEESEIEEYKRDSSMPLSPTAEPGTNPSKHESWIQRIGKWAMHQPNSTPLSCEEKGGEV